MAETLARIKVLFEGQTSGLTRAAQEVSDLLERVNRTAQAATRPVAATSSALSQLGMSMQAAARPSSTMQNAVTRLGQSLERMGQSAQIANQSLQNSVGVLGAVEQRFTRVFEMVVEFGLALKAVQAVESAFSGFANAVVSVNAQLERSELFWRVFLGNGEQAKAVIQGLLDIAAKTPFTFDQLLGPAQKLLVVGVPLESIRDALMDIVTVGAALGGTPDTINRITLALTQMIAKQRVMGEEMRQLTEAGVPAWQILADTLQVDVATAMEMVRKGQVDAMTFIQGFSNWARNNLGNLSADMAQTFSGAMTTLTDSINLTIARGFQPFFDWLRQGVVELANFAASDRMIVDWAANINGAVQLVVSGLQYLGQAFASALSDILYLVSAVGRAIYEALQWLNPFARHSPSLVEEVEEGVQQIIDAYGSVDRIRARLTAVRIEIRALEAQQRALNSTMRDAQRELRAQQKILREYQDQLRNVEKRMSEVEARIRDLVRATLVEELPFFEQLAAFDRRMKQLRLQKLRLEFAGVPSTFIEDIELQLEVLQKRAEMVDLERDLNIGPLREQLESAANAALGLNEAISFGQALAEISALTAELGRLRSEQRNWQQLVEQQERVVAALEDQIESLRDALDVLRDALDALRNEQDLLRLALQQANKAMDRTGDSARQAREPVVGLGGAFAILRQELRAVATTPLVVDLSGLEELKARSRAAAEQFTQAMRQIEQIVPGALGMTTSQARDLANQLIHSGESADDLKQRLKSLRINVDDFGYALDMAKDALREQEDVLRRYERMLRDVEAAIRATEAAIRGLVDVPLVEEQPFIEQLRELEKQRKQLELQRIELILAGAPEEQIRAVEDQLRRLDAEARKIDLQRQLTIEPLRDQLRQMADEALGVGQILTFEQAKQAMLEHIENLQKLREEQQMLNELVAEQRELVEDWRAKIGLLTQVYDGLRQQLDHNRLALDNLKASSDEAAESLGKQVIGWPTETAGWIEEGQRRLDEFKRKADEARESLSAMLAPALPLLQAAGEYLAHFVVAAGGLIVLNIVSKIALAPFESFLSRIVLALGYVASWFAPVVQAAGILLGVLGTGVSSVIQFASGLSLTGTVAGIFARILGMVLTAILTVQRTIQFLKPLLGGLNAAFAALSTGGLAALWRMLSSSIPSAATILKGVLIGLWGMFTVGFGIITRTVSIFGTLMGIFSTVVGVVLSILNPIRLVTTGFGILVTVVGALKAPFTALQILLGGLFGGFWGLVNAVTLLWLAFKNNWFGIRDIFGPVVQAILDGIQRIRQAFSEGGIAEGIKALFDVGGDLVGQIVQAFIQLGENIWAAIQKVDWGAVAQALMDGLRQAAEGIGQGLLDVGQRLWDFLSSIDWAAVAQTILDALMTAWERLTEYGAQVISWIRALFDQVDWAAVAQTILDTLMAAWERLTEYGERVLNWINGLLNQVDWMAVAQTVVDALVQAWTAITIAGDKLLTWLQQSFAQIDWEKLGESLQKGVERAWSKVKGFAAQGEGEDDGGWLGTIQRRLQTFIGFVEQIRSLIEDISSAVEPFNLIKEAFSSLKNAVSETAKVIAEEAGPIWEQLKDTLHALEPVLTTIGIILGGVVVVAVMALVVAFRFLAEILELILPIAVRILAFFIQSFLIGVETVAKVITGLVDLVVSLIRGDWSSAWEAAKSIVRAVFEGVKKFLGNIWDTVVDVFKRIYDWLANTIVGQIVSAVVGKISELASQLLEKWESIKNTVMSVWDTIRTTISDRITEAKNKVENIITAVRDGLAAKWTEISNNVLAMWELIKTTVTEKVTALKDAALGIITEARDKLATLWDEIKSRALNVWESMRQAFENSKQGLLNILKWPFEQLRDSIEGIMQAAFRFARGPLNMLIRAMNRINEAIANTLRWIGEKLGIDALTSITFTPIPEIGEAPSYAEGTAFHPGGAALVGEKGPELVLLPRGAAVLPSELTEQLLNTRYGVDFIGHPGIGGLGDFVSNIVGTVKDVASSVFDLVREGAASVIGRVFRVVDLPTLTGALAHIPPALITLAKDALIAFAQELFKQIEQRVDQWVKPLAQYVVTQEYGPAAPGMAYSWHTGIDLGAPLGTPVYAARAGTVVAAGWDGGYGLRLILQHAQGLSTLYAHLSSYLVELGQSVAAGQQIGAVGSTGYSTGPHLHFEIRENGMPVNPRKYIAFAAGGILQEPVFGVGLRSGAAYSFAERQPELVMPLSAGGALAPEGTVVEIHFHGPVTIEARDREEAERAMGDIAWAIAQRLRQKGLR